MQSQDVAVLYRFLGQYLNSSGYPKAGPLKRQCLSDKHKGDHMGGRLQTKWTDVTDKQNQVCYGFISFSVIF